MTKSETKSDRSPFKHDVRDAYAPRAPERDFFSIPPALKQIFDGFPLVTYAENTLPVTSPNKRDQHILYVFQDQAEARKGSPSYNPACLKWQTFLKLSGLPFKTESSCNHASPSGALPFLLPAAAKPETSQPQDPISINKLKRWLRAQQSADVPQEPLDARYDAYVAMLDNGIRKAWLYQLYLAPENNALSRSLYVDQCSSNPLVRTTVAYQLREAAASQISKSSASAKVVEAEIMGDARDVLDALSTLLGEDHWFFGQDKPGIFDASVFAYTYLLAPDVLDWQTNTLGEHLESLPNLVHHRNQLVNLCY